MQSLGGRQNCRATPYLSEDESSAAREPPILWALRTLAKPAILPPNSSSPGVGGIDSSTCNRLPGSNVPVVSKYNPPELTFTV
jgi:hypothetical protein